MTELLQAILHWLGRLALDTAVLLAIFGLVGKRWLDSRLQRHDREMAEMKSGLEGSVRLLQAEIDKTVLVTKVHFETEFEAYKAVFAELSETRIQFGGLRPSMDIVPANDTREARRERLAQLVQKAQEAYNQLITTSENLSPFYPAEIYRQIQECQHIFSREINDILVSSHDEFTHEWFGRGRENMTQFTSAYNGVSDSIRERISKLALLRNT